MVRRSRKLRPEKFCRLSRIKPVVSVGSSWPKPAGTRVERPYRAFGYPWVPGLYILAATTILVVLLLYKTSTTGPGLVLVLTGIPAYMLWRRSART